MSIAISFKEYTMNNLMRNIVLLITNSGCGCESCMRSPHVANDMKIVRLYEVCSDACYICIDKEKWTEM